MSFEWVINIYTGVPSIFLHLIKNKLWISLGLQMNKHLQWGYRSKMHSIRGDYIENSIFSHRDHFHIIIALMWRVNERKSVRWGMPKTLYRLVHASNFFPLDFFLPSAILFIFLWGIFILLEPLSSLHTKTIDVSKKREKKIR